MRLLSIFPYEDFFASWGGIQAVGGAIVDFQSSLMKISLQVYSHRSYPVQKDNFQSSLMKISLQACSYQSIFTYNKNLIAEVRNIANNNVIF